MSNRVLTRANDAVPEILEDGEPHNVGIWEEVTIECSAAGQPRILVIITRYDNDREYDQMVVTIPDGREFLAPVNEWLRDDQEVRDYDLERAALAEWQREIAERAWIEGMAYGVNYDAGDYEVAPEPIENPYAKEVSA